MATKKMCVSVSVNVSVADMNEGNAQMAQVFNIELDYLNPVTKIDIEALVIDALLDFRKNNKEG